MGGVDFMSIAVSRLWRSIEELNYEFNGQKRIVVA